MPALHSCNAPQLYIYDDVEVFSCKNCGFRNEINVSKTLVEEAKKLTRKYHHLVLSIKYIIDAERLCSEFSILTDTHPLLIDFKKDFVFDDVISYAVLSYEEVPEDIYNNSPLPRIEIQKESEK